MHLRSLARLGRWAGCRVRFPCRFPHCVESVEMQPMRIDASSAGESSSRWRCCAAAGLSLIVAGCMLNVGLLVSIRGRLEPTGPTALPPAGGSDASGKEQRQIDGMVHCVVKGDDLCWLSTTCTDVIKGDRIQVTGPTWPNGTRRPGGPLYIPGCQARTITAREGGKSCFAAATTTERQLKECSKVSAEGGSCRDFKPWDGFSPYPCHCNGDGQEPCNFPLDYLEINVTTGCNPGWSRDDQNGDAEFDANAGAISGSFHWKVTYAVAHNCVPIGGTYWEPGADKASGTGKDPGVGAPNQAFFCPKEMQAGEGPRVVAPGHPLQNTGCVENTHHDEPNGGATWQDYATTRGWGECHIPQTETLGSDSCRANL